MKHLQFFIHLLALFLVNGLMGQNGCPDLVVEKLSIISYDGKYINYAFTIKNVGSAPANLNTGNGVNAGNVSVQAFISNDTIFNNTGDIAAGGTILGLSPLPILAVGDTLRGTFGASVNFAPCDYPYLILRVDWGEKVVECSEINNLKAATTLGLSNQPCSLTFFVDPTTTSYDTNYALVPIKVSNFTKIPGFQFSLRLSDTLVSSIDTILVNTELIKDLHFFRVDLHTFSILWTDVQAVGIDLADNSTILWLKIKLKGPLGACTYVNFTDEPTEIFAILSDFKGIKPTTINARICLPNLITISGAIYRENEVWIKDVTVSCTGAKELNFVTSSRGTYTFKQLKAGQDVVIRPQRDLNHIGGVNVLDIVLIQRHILSKDTFSTPYQWIAADVNKSGTISVADILNIRRLILGIAQTFPGNTSWRFVPKGYKFDDPRKMNPLSKPFPDSILVTKPYKDSINVDFVGVKVGDVNLSANAQLADEGELELSLQNHSFKYGEELVVPVRVRNFLNVAAFQLETVFDSDVLHLEKVSPGTIGGIDKTSFGYDELRNGVLPCLWLHSEETGKPSDEAVLFYLHFQALSDGNLKEHLQVASAINIPQLAVNHAGQEMGIRTLWAEVALSNSVMQSPNFERVVVRPNPFFNNTCLDFELERSGIVKLIISDLAGKEIYADTRMLDRGKQQWHIDKAQLPHPGAYLYFLQIENRSKSGKLISLTP